ncbi:MAG: DUF3617 domain-containing protein [Deltaproteobacteria bacterium]|nr:DUF3617 domain-containing protein [Deltaproteobacteria bacterium]MCL5792976.1 DUF3617 domain-containing protein [Deltaproteobacteria bacterium]
MNKKTIITTGIFVVLLSAIAMAGPANMKQGLWKITTSMSMPGMPFQMRPTTITTCFDKKNITNPDKAMPTTPQQNKDCKMTDRKISGSHVTWKMVCTGKHPATSTGDFTYHNGTSYNGTMTTVFHEHGTTRKVIDRYTGERVGDCK